jgi:hypothetical protein
VLDPLVLDDIPVLLLETLSPLDVTFESSSSPDEPSPGQPINQAKKRSERTPSARNDTVRSYPPPDLAARAQCGSMR